MLLCSTLRATWNSSSWGEHGSQIDRRDSVTRKFLIVGEIWPAARRIRLLCRKVNSSQTIRLLRVIQDFVLSCFGNYEDLGI